MKIVIYTGQQKRNFALICVLMAGTVFGARVAVARAQNSNAVSSNSAVTNTPGAGRLEAAKLRVCQNRQAALNQIMSRRANRAERQLNVFSTIASRVETFYVNKGRTISNYDALVAKVNETKTAAEIQVATLKQDATFDCTAENPKGMATTFKDQLRTTAVALQAYKTAIKNLIVGVKSAQGQTSSNNNAHAANTNQS
ncbi:MAG: hypothetical protein HY092_02735 [Candidatus Kerfeldbacteria bacterium]|nr:hypothetical protein [Candidatus Kerfeldbacteria bacterium]